MVANNTITELTLRGNDLGDEGVEALATALIVSVFVGDAQTLCAAGLIWGWWGIAFCECVGGEWDRCVWVWGGGGVRGPRHWLES